MFFLTVSLVVPILLQPASADIMALQFEEEAQSVALDPVRDLVYVGTSDSLKVIDANTLKIVNSLDFGFRFYEIAVNSKADRVYVTHLVPVDQPGFSAEHHISMLNATTHEVIESVAVGSQHENPVPLALDQDNDVLYFRKGFDPDIYALDGSSGNVSLAFQFEKETVFAFDYSGNRIYTSSYDPNGPIVLSVRNSTDQKKIAKDVILDAPIGSYIIPIVVDSSKRLLYVPVLDKAASQELPSSTGSIYVFDIAAADLILKKKIEMHTPTRLVIDEKSNAFYILDVDAGLYSIRSDTYARHLITDGGRLLGDYAFDPTSGILYLLDRTTSTLHAYSREQALGLYWTGESLQHVDEPSVYSLSGERLEAMQVGQPGAVTVTVRNLDNVTLDAMILVEVRDGNGITLFLASQRTTIPPIRDYTMQVSWTPDRICWVSNPGCENHLIRTFAVSLTDKPTAQFGYVRQSNVIVVPDLGSFAGKNVNVKQLTSPTGDLDSYVMYSIDNGSIANIIAEPGLGTVMVVFEAVTAEANLVIMMPRELVNVLFPTIGQQVTPGGNPVFGPEIFVDGKPVEPQSESIEDKGIT